MARNLLGSLRTLASRFLAPLHRRALDRELDEELESHLDLATEEHRRRGLSAEEARTAALRSFGGVTQTREDVRLHEGFPFLENLRRDWSYALRQMRRSPGFAASVIGTLALGIAAATAMFTVVDHVLLRLLPYRNARRLVILHEGDSTGKGAQDVPWLDIEAWIKRSHSFEQIAFNGTMNGRSYLEGNTDALQISGITASSNLFSVLGVTPLLGRSFLSETPGFASGKDNASIVLSYAVWQTAFGGQTSVLGKVVHINGNPYTVIGVMPRGFSYPWNTTDLDQVWVPIQLSTVDQTRNYSAMNYGAIARLRKGVTPEAARAEMTAIQKTLAPKYTDPDLRKEHNTVVLERYGETLVDKDLKKALLALLAASGVLWLIANVNVTNLLLARSTARQREIAMRRALGASRWRVVRQMVTEGLVLSSAAALLGVGLAVAGIHLAESARPIHLNLDLSARVNPTILAVLCGLTVLSALISTAWPALVAVGAPIEPALKQGGQQAGSGRRHHRLRGALVALEVAMSLTLLVACGLLLRTIYTLRRVPLGFRTDHVLVASLNLPSWRFSGKNMVADLYNPLLDRVQHQHGVEAAGLMSEVPLGQTFNIALTLRMNGNNVAARLKPVSPDIQRIFGFPMLAGRFFDSSDTPTSEPVAVVNPAFARLYAPDKHDPSSLIGTKFWSTRKNVPAHIIGILNNEHQGTIAQASQPEVEVCLCQIDPQATIYGPATIAMDLAIRTEQPTAQMIPQIRDILRHASPELATATITTMDQIVEDSYGSQRLAAHLLEIFGGSALLLCVAGLYGLLAYVVTQRTRELGVRIALGAQRGNLLWMVLRQAAVMLLIGVAIGTALAWVSGRLVRGFLYGVSAHDGWTLAGAALLLLASGLLAAYLPARRAAGVDPMTALRTE